MKNVLILVAALILLSAKSDELLQQANIYKSQKNYGLAIEMYENALAESMKEGDNVKTKEATKELGMVHYQLKNYIKSEWYFDQLVNDADCDADVLYKYARLQQINGRTERAEYYYNKWAEKKGDASLATPYIHYTQLIKKGEGSDHTISVNSMGFNTKDYDEYSPVVNNGKLIFTSNRPGKTITPKDNYGHYFTDLYQSANLDYKGDKSTFIFSNSLKTIYNESSATFTKDGNTVFFTGNNLKKTKESANYSLGIYTAQYDGYKWSKPKLLEFITPEYNYAFPAISPDGLSLYFASDIPNGSGGMDIYKSDYNSGEWGTPSNLGLNVNSTENEVYPFVLNNGSETVLYFSTDGKPGYGGLDIFSSKMVSGSPEAATILSAPINSSYDDFGYWATISNTFGYISSNRDGSDDIFYFKKSDEIIPTSSEPKVVYIEKKTKEKETETTPEAKKKETKKRIEPEKEEPAITKEETETTPEVKKKETKKRIQPEKEEPVITEEETDPALEVVIEEKKEVLPEKKPVITKKESKPAPKIKEKKIVETEVEPETEKEVVPEPKKEVIPVKKTETKKTVTPKPAAKANTAGVIEHTDIKKYYLIVYTAYNLNNLRSYRDSKHKEADILHSENNFYLIAYPLSGDADEAYNKFKQMNGKYPGAWFYIPKS